MFILVKLSRILALCMAFMLCFTLIQPIAFADSSPQSDESLVYNTQEMGDRGRFVIPRFQYAVPLYDDSGSNAQAVVNKEDSAVFLESFGTTPIIADLRMQGFDIIAYTEPGDQCCIQKETGALEWYDFVFKDTSGHNTGYDLLDSSGKSVLLKGSDYLLCYTTDARSGFIIIVCWVKSVRTDTSGESDGRRQATGDDDSDWITIWPVRDQKGSVGVKAAAQASGVKSVSQPATNTQGSSSGSAGGYSVAPPQPPQSLQTQASHSEPAQTVQVETEKQYGSGVYGDSGRLVIPGSDYAIPLYCGDKVSNTTIASIVDAQDSAVVLSCLGSTPVVGDHYNQGFTVIKSVGEGSRCYIEDENHNKTWYTFSSIDRYGTNAGTKLLDSDGNNVLQMGDDYLACYTCNNDPVSYGTVTIVIWEKEQVLADDSSQPAVDQVAGSERAQASSVQTPGE